MKRNYHIMLQQRHLSAIVGALRFRQQLMTGGVFATFGKLALETWRELPLVASGPYPARIGCEEDVRRVVDNACESIVRIVWHGNPTRMQFSDSPSGSLVSRVLLQCKQKVRHTRYMISVGQEDFGEMSRAVEFEMRTRIGHFGPMDDALYREMVSRQIEGDDLYKRRRAIDGILTRTKNVAWQIDHCGNYGPWFSYKTQFLYDIYSVFQHELGHWRYGTINHMLPNVPLMEIKHSH